ncbi:MAG: glycerol-3-phosphate acyltransferase [Candidatus Heimdallarchaeota archaeon]|nr:glycerol-3-phosphate acyltransferase [Candidatus Heimdallarchaeota archaeon]
MEPIILTGLILLGVGSYLLGSICWAIIIGNIKLKKDIRDIGDGNPGAYNTGRKLGLKIGLFVMFLDSLKGLIPAIIATTVDFKDYQGWAVGIAGTMSLVGHCYPIYFGFKGGNGYSTIFGFMLIYNPFMILEWGLFVFLLTLIFKYIRPIQMISIILTGISGLFIRWDFFWINLGYRLDYETAITTIPITILVVSLFQLPRFIPYFFGIFKGTEEKMYLLGKLFRRSKANGDISLTPQE